MKTQKQMKNELINVILNNKCYDYVVDYLGGRKETVIRIANKKEVKY